MPNRFTDTNKWEDPWFNQLEPNHKLAYLYLIDKCDHAGFYQVNLPLASFQLGFNLQAQALMDALGDRIHQLRDDLWFLTKFISYQQPSGLNPKNNCHSSIIKKLNKNKIDIRPWLAPNQELPRASVNSKGKSKGKVKEESLRGGSSNLMQIVKSNPAAQGLTHDQLYYFVMKYGAQDDDGVPRYAAPGFDLTKKLTTWKTTRKIKSQSQSHQAAG